METVKKRYRLIACEVMFREICLCASRCRNIIDISFMEQGYHDLGDQKMRERLQAEIDGTHTDHYDAILLGYGLCSNGTENLRAPIPLVIPKAHDCITLLMGSKEGYKEYFYANPGTFFLSSGWLERDKIDFEEDVLQMTGIGKDKDYYVKRYGEESAAYLFEMLGDLTSNYKKIAFIDMQTGEGDGSKQLALERAKQKNWEFEELKGNLSLLEGLLAGNWDEDKYLVVLPGSTIVPSYDHGVVKARPI